MKIVIIGAKERCTDLDRQQVDYLIDLANATYQNCIFATTMAHAGVGRFVKEKCLQKDKQGKFRFQLVLFELRTYARDLPKAEFGDICMSCNAALFEIGDVFCYFANDARRGTLEELLEKRVLPSGRPCKVYLPGDTVVLP